MQRPAVGRDAFDGHHDRLVGALSASITTAPTYQRTRRTEISAIRLIASKTADRRYYGLQATPPPGQPLHSSEERPAAAGTM
jgi:hypothetical protein